MRFFLFLAVMLCLASPVWSATYYVSNCLPVVGNDSNNGTAPATPWLTLGHVTGNTVNGDTVNLQSGCIWREQITSSTSTIHWQFYGSGLKPSIRGSDTKNVAGNWTNKSGNLWYVSSITHDPGFVMHDDTSQCTGKACAGLIGQRKTSEGALAVQWDSWYDSGNSREEIYSVGNPTGVSSMLEVPVRSDVISDLCHSATYNGIDFREFYDKIYVQFGCATASTFTNVDFGPTATYHTQFNDNGGTGMTATFTGNTFTDWGIISGAEQFAIMGIGGSGPITVVNNVATLNHSNTVGIGFVDEDVNSWIQLVSGNKAFNYGTQPLTCYGIYQAATIASGQTITVTGNEGFNCGLGVDVNGIDDGGATPSVEVSFNYMENSATGDVSDHHAYRFYATNGANVPTVFKYNIANGTADGSNSHACLALDGGLALKAYGNTLYGCDDGILLKNSSTGQDVRNNGMAFNRGFGLNVSSGSVTTCATNGFYSNTGGNYSGIPACAGDIYGNPFFGNAAGKDLRLSKNSAWINVGTNISSTYQFGLNPRSVFPFGTVNQNLNGAWDIGAFVFRSGNSWLAGSQ